VATHPDPGTVTLHRLNRAEYNNTVRDLLGTRATPADDFPADDHGYGYDNNADVLALSPFQVELYERAAESLIAEALAVARTEEDLTTREAEEVGSDGGARWRDNGWQLRDETPLTTTLSFPTHGRYTLTVRAFGVQAGADPVQMAIRVGTVDVRTFSVRAEADAPAEYRVTLAMEAGEFPVGVVLLNGGSIAEEGERSLVVDWIRTEGPQIEYTAVVDLPGSAIDPGEPFGASDRERGVYTFYSEGSAAAQIPAEVAGDYRVSVLAAGDQAGQELPRLRLGLDGDQVAEFEVETVADRPEFFQTTVTLDQGLHQLSVSFSNDFYDPDTGADRNLHIGAVLVEGPLHLPPTNLVRESLLQCTAVPGSPACADEILVSFLRRAWRRPPTNQELDRYLGLVRTALSEGGQFEDGIALALRASLVSPHFIFRVEVDPDPTSDAPHPLTDHELATRLSYFLWSSMPDEELLTLADQGALQDDEVLAAQTERMLADTKARALTDNFAGQWLQTRALFDVVPDYNVFPEYDEALKYGLYEETATFFETFLREDLPVGEMFVADFTFVNERVANHYGIEGIEGPALRRVTPDREATNRRGLLTHAGVHTLTAYPTRTSPVKRGQWVLSQLLCSEPPPPPPGVEGLIEEVDPTGTLRERLEQHRADPTCASCHALMDPIGFAMESYDGIGRHRTDDRGFPIDPSGELVTGETFSDVHELADILAKDERVTKCVARHMATYALGRGIEFEDAAMMNDIHQGFAADGGQLRRLVHHIVQSPLFRWRRGSAQEAE
jgi:hypothetical protein